MLAADLGLAVRHLGLVAAAAYVDAYAGCDVPGIAGGIEGGLWRIGCAGVIPGATGTGVAGVSYQQVAEP